MKYFDANCVLGNFGMAIPKFSFHTPDNLIASMDNLGIEKSVVSLLVDRENSFGTDIKLKEILLNDLADYRDRLIPSLSINLQSVVNAGYNTKQYADDLMGLDADVFNYNVATNNGIQLWRFAQVAEKLIEKNALLRLELYPDRGINGKKMAFHYWDDIFNLATEYPELKLVIFAHKMNADAERAFNLLAKCKNVFMDISAYQRWMAIENLCGEFGAERFVFGSFAPVFSPAQFMLELVYADISENDKQKIAYGNLEQLIK